MIDVLILLFCMFLLMPYVQPGDEHEGPTARPDAAATADELRREVARLTRENERFARGQDASVRQQLVTVLEIDPQSGRLFERGSPRREVASQADAFALIEQARKAARGREIYVLLLYPDVLSGYPEQRQIASYERWFASVPHGYDRPFARGGSR
jgi:hypothetical protein